MKDILSSRSITAFLKTGSLESIALETANKQLSYKELWHKVSLKSRQLDCVAGRLVGVYSEDPFVAIINMLSVIEAGGYAFMVSDVELQTLEDTFTSDVIKDLIIFTDSKNTQHLRGFQKIEENINHEVSLTINVNEAGSKKGPGGLILAAPGKTKEAYLLSIDDVKQHVNHTVSSFELDSVSKLIPGNSFLATDLLEWVLPALAANATLFLEEVSEGINTIPSQRFLIKLAKADLHTDKLRILAKNYGQNTDRIILSSDLRLTYSDLVLIKEYFPNLPELHFTYKLPRLNYSVIEGTLSTEGTEAKSLESLSYLRPFGKANVAVINEYYQPVPANVPAYLFYESPALSVAVGAQNLLLNVTIRNQERILRKLPFVSSFSAEGGISLLYQENRVLIKNNNKINADLIEEALRDQVEIEDAFVNLTKIDNKQFVVAFIVLSKGKPFSSGSKLRKKLKRLLAVEMLPDHIEIVSEIVRDFQGNVEESQFEALEINIVSEKDFSSEEIQLAQLWKRVLGVEVIRRDDNFFELGGHSLSATKLVALGKKELKLNFAIKDVFTYSMFSEMVRFLQTKKEIETVEIASQNLKDGDKVTLSFAQERLWFIDQFQGSAQYNVPAIFEINGQVDKDLLSNALAKLIKRHKVLRTVIRKENGAAYQIVTDPVWELQYEEIIEPDLAKNFIEKIIDEPFKLSEDCMLRALLIKREEKAFTLVITVHHIALDGWSAYILLNELREIYEDGLYGKSSSLPELPVDYIDYAVWQRKYVNDAYLEKELSYWTKKLANITYLELPIDYPRPAQQQFNGKRKTFKVNNNVYESLSELSNQEGVTLFMTLLSAFKVLLYKYTGQKDICVGSPIAGRHHLELENLVGFFANTLALRSDLELSESFTDLLEQVKQTTLDAYSHQDVPFEKIVDALGIEREMNRTPVFQVMFSMENVPDLSSLKMGDLLLDNIPVDQKTTQFDWNIYMEESEEFGLVFHVEFDTDLFRDDTIDRMGQHYNYLLSSIARNPDQPIKKLALMSKQEELELIAEFNDNRINFPFDLTTDAIIDNIALKYPDKIALKDANEERSYKGLRENGSRLAGLLKRQINVEKEMVIGLLADRSVQFVESIYGIWKSGGTYLPIHPELPKNRMSIILANAGVETLCVSQKYLDIAIALLGEQVSLKQIVCIDNSLDRDLSVYEGCNFYNKSHIDAQQVLDKSYSEIDNLAYVIYTSGSTGMPKGAMLEHRGMLNHLFIMINDLDMDNHSNVAQNASQSFDISVWQMFAALIIGGKTIIYSHWETLQVQKFAEQLTQHQVSLLQLVPSYLTVLLDEMENHEKAFFQNLKYLLVTGETIKKHVLERWFNKYPHIKVVNAYGPTEAADDITLYIMDSVPESSSIPIGRSLANLNIYIVNEDEQLCPKGVKGEIWVSGLGVGRGYLNDTEKTAQSFINDPFQGFSQTRLYKTGDLGRFLPDGNIEFFGRKDYQVKVNGYRIELEEIEQYLNDLKVVKEAIAIVHDSEDHVTQLFGFVTCYHQVDSDTLKQELAGYLPDFMVPSRIIVLDSFPLTPNGKVDRKILPSLITVVKADLNPATEEISKTQRVLIEIWKELLELDEVGITQSFFELGGHSLKVISMISQIQKQLEVEITIKDVFTCPTIKLLSQLIDESTTVLFEPIPAVEESDYYPVSNAQKRLWVLDRFVEDVSAYNSYNAYVINGHINVDAFSEAILSIINRHEILRTTFSEKEGEPVQIIHTDIKKKDICSVIDYSNSSKGYKEVIEELGVVANLPFNLSNELLFRSRIYILSEDSYIFFCCMHHIICDGWSNNILVKELLKNYSSFEKRQVSSLPFLKIQYKDYAAWNLKQVASNEFSKHKSYWHTKLEGDLPVLALPTYRSRPAVQVFNGDAIEYSFDQEILNGLKELSKKTNGSLFITLTALLKVLFYKYTGQRDIILGTVTAGRTHPDLENQLGYYINTLALRSTINPDKSFLEFVNEIKDNTIEAFDHQDYPFDQLVNELDFERDISRNPIFDVMILLQSFDEDEDSLLAEGLENATISPVTLGGHGSPFDMDFDFTEKKDSLHLLLTFNNVIYTRPQMESMIKHLEILMEKVLNTPEVKTGSVEIITQEEQAFIEAINDTDKNFNLEKTYHHYLEKFARETPGKTAVIYKDSHISYEKLNALSNQIARTLQNYIDIHKDTLIGVFMDRSDEMMAAIFGIWKSRGAYIPLEKKMPDNRIVSCTGKAGLKAVIADRNLVSDDLEAMLETKTRLIYIQDLLKDASKENADNLNLSIDPDSLCVTIFTSGSTGKPKGAMNEHKGRMNHALSTIEYLKMDADTVLVQNASHSFDISIWQTFTAIISGGTTLILEDEMVNTPEKLLESIINNKANILQIVPSYLSMLLEIIEENRDFHELPVKSLICCGEAINPRSILRWKKLYPATVFVNDYGPAEASDGTTWNVFKEIESDTAIIPIGKPIYNMRNYIVDDYMNLVPVGVVGEICVSGVGVGRGYVNDEERTKAVFQSDPFFSGKEERLYRTGDLGKLLPDGTIQFYGRKDYQVKVNGQRIELGEIEAKLLEVSGVKEAAVIDKVNSANGRKYLVAFAALHPESNLDAKTLRFEISRELPIYMIPSEIQLIDRIPVTQNGKIDRKHLDKLILNPNDHHKDYIAPETDVEKILVEAWKSVLDTEHVGINDNFYESGGDSIAAIQVSSFLYKNEYQVEVKDIMRFPHIREVAGFVKPLSRLADQSMILGAADLTPIQAAFFEMQKLVPDHYNQSVLLKSRSSLNTEALHTSFSKLLEWHDILRASFKRSSSGTYVQAIGVNCEMANIEVHNYAESGDLALAKEVANGLQESLSIENGVLIKAAVIQMQKADYLLIVIHHLVVDTVSWRILIEDLTTAYQQTLNNEDISLPAKTDSFKLWSQSLKDFTRTDSFNEEVKYWSACVSTPFENISYDYPSEMGDAKVKNKKAMSVRLSSEYVTRLETEVHKAFNTEINDILLAALALSVKKCFGLLTVPIMLESHGRVKLKEDININRTVGWFTSEFPVLLDTSEAENLANFIKIVKDYLHKVPNSGIGFGLLKFIAKGRNSEIVDAATPQIAFNYLGKVDDEDGTESIFQWEDKTLGNEECIQNQSDYALEIVAMGREGFLEFNLEYHDSQFNEDTISKWLEIYINILQELIDFCANRSHSEVTPTDFDYSDLSLQDLNELNDLF
jgi:amino acid adenylation domain-containing protein/non-ribosomal peptide synthase protein (TIGR01720 family)